MLLAGTSDLVSVVTGGTQTIGVYAGIATYNSGVTTYSSQLTSISTAVTTTVVSSPASGTQARVKTLTICNQGASSETASITATDGTNTVTLASYTLAAGEVVVVLDEEGLVLLTSTSDTLAVVTVGSGSIHCYTEWADLLSGSVTPGRTVTAAITTGTTTTICGSPASSTQRNIKEISLYNNGSSAQTVTVQVYNGSVTSEIYTCSIPASCTLLWTAQSGWQLSYNGIVLPNNGVPTLVDVTLGTSSSYTSGTPFIPNVVAYLVIVNIATAFSAGATIQLGIAGNANLFFDSTQYANANALNMINQFIVPIRVAVGTSVAYLVATIGGSPGLGAGTMTVLSAVPVS